MSPDKLEEASLVDDCWNKIGVKGTGSCERLGELVHCHNCDVFASVSLTLFERDLPEEQTSASTSQLPPLGQQPAGKMSAVLVFRVGEEWLALDVQTVVEVTETRFIHRIPHRSNRLLLGLANIRGDLQLCVSPAELLGIETAAADAGTPASMGRWRRAGSTPSCEPEADEAASTPIPDHAKRLLVFERQGQRWVLTADEIAGIHRLPASSVVEVPATVSKSVAKHTLGTFTWQDRQIGLLAPELVFAALKRSIG